MSRIRQIKPSWFLDKELRRGVSAEAREFYIGLWMLADDAGWLTWDVDRIAAELYPYDGVARRERNVATWGSRLQGVQPDAPHLVRYSCGHAHVPKMPGHQRIAGNQTFKVRQEHLACRDVAVLDEAGEPRVATASHGRVGNGKERNGRVAGARPDVLSQRDEDDAQELARLREAGLYPVGARR